MPIADASAAESHAGFFLVSTLPSQRPPAV